MQTYTESSLVEAVGELANKEIGHLKIDLKINSGTEDLEANVKDNLYLIIREAVMNIKLHAGAKRAMVSVDAYPNRIHLLIQDDGRGFCLSNITNETFGLMRIQKHVFALGGTYELETAVGDGTAHWAYIPLPILGLDEAGKPGIKIHVSWDR